jgi:lysyl-tRNA synthetase class II
MQARVLALATTVMILLSSCDAPTDAPAPKAADPKRQAIQFERIAKIADQSCMCAMAGRDTSTLDRELERLTASLEKQESATSSVPLQGQNTCYPELGERACVGRIVITRSSSKSDFVCSEEQADELQAVWDAAVKDDGSIESFNRALPKRNEALLKRLRGMHAEAAVKIPQSACN